MNAVIKINKPQPETRLAPEEIAARQRRAGFIKGADPIGTREPFKKRANRPAVHQGGSPAKPA